MGTEENPKWRFRDHWYLFSLLLLNLIIFRIASRLYGDQFIVFRDAISDLGATVTSTGLPNRQSPYVFVPGMVVSGIIMLVFARYLDRKHANGRSIRPRLARLCSAGFLLMPAPHNLPVCEQLHMTGAAFIFFAFWALGMGYLTDCRELGMHALYWIGMAVLQGTVVSYGVLFTINSPSKQTAQGFGVLGLISTLVVSTYALSRTLRVVTRSESSVPATSAR